MASWGDPIYSSSLTLLIDRLEQIPSLRDPASRRLCLDLLGGNLGGNLVIDEYPTTRAQLIGIVQACRRQHPRALNAFIDAVEQVESGSLPVQRARAAVEDMTALDLVAERDRQELLSLLNEHPHDKLTELVRAAAGPAAELVADEQYPAEALATLERLNAGPSDVPPLLVFVERIAAAFGEQIGERLRVWNDRQAARSGLTEQLQEVRRDEIAAPPPTPQHEGVAYLVIRIEPDHLEPELYSVTHWQQNNANEWHPRRGDMFTGDLDAVQDHVSALVDDAESSWARKANTIKVEFVLPYVLLNLPVDQWDLDPTGPIPRPLGLHYQVVVRSLDRARNRKLHREWKQRWETLKHASAEVSSFAEQWLWSDGAKQRQLTALDAKLAIRKDVVSLVLRSVPGGAGPGEVLVGIRTGVPIMLWSRTESGRTAFETEVKALCDALPALVEELQRLRSKARLSTRPDTHVGSRVALLWDDPDRPVEPMDPPAAPEEVSA